MILQHDFDKTLFKKIKPTSNPKKQKTTNNTLTIVVSLYVDLEVGVKSNNA